MRARLHWTSSSWLAALALAALGAVAAAQPPAQVPARCERACLEELVESYLAAVIAHEPRRLPLSADVLYTENEQRVAVGDGFWQTATGRGEYNHYFADPVTSQAAWLGHDARRQHAAAHGAAAAPRARPHHADRDVVLPTRRRRTERHRRDGRAEVSRGAVARSRSSTWSAASSMRTRSSTSAARCAASC